jgi:hypothetical protein
MKKISILGAMLFILFIITSCKTEEQKKQDLISACMTDVQSQFGLGDKAARDHCERMWRIADDANKRNR